jgi:hypothetical protein
MKNTELPIASSGNKIGVNGGEQETNLYNNNKTPLKDELINNEQMIRSSVENSNKNENTTLHDDKSAINTISQIKEQVKNTIPSIEVKNAEYIESSNKQSDESLSMRIKEDLEEPQVEKLQIKIEEDEEKDYFSESNGQTPKKISDPKQSMTSPNKKSICYSKSINTFKSMKVFPSLNTNPNQNSQSKRQKMYEYCGNLLPTVDSPVRLSLNINGNNHTHRKMTTESKDSSVLPSAQVSTSTFRKYNQNNEETEERKYGLKRKPMSSNNLGKFLVSSTKLVKKITSSSLKGGKEKTNESVIEKVDEIFDKEFDQNLNTLLNNFLECHKELEKEIEDAHEELLTHIQILYEEKIRKHDEVLIKYEPELSKLKELFDDENPDNVNNIIYYSVLVDKQKELAEIEEEFLKGKDEGVKEMKQKISERKEEMERLKERKAKELHSEIAEELRNKVILSLVGHTERKSDISLFDISTPKKVDFNSNRDTMVLFNTTQPIGSGLRKTMSFKKI